MDSLFWQWFAGQMDGDGTFHVMSAGHCPVISMTKATKGRHTLVRIRDKLGGSFCEQRSRGERRQDQTTWRVNGTAARAVARQLIPFLKIKRREAESMSRYQVGRFWSATITKDGVQRSNLNRREVSAIIGKKEDAVSRHLRIGAGKAVVNGWTIEKEVDARDAICKQLKAFKTTPHDTIHSNSLHPAYIAGFVDAEGCVSLVRTCARLSIGQKWPAILEAIQRQYGGSITRRYDAQYTKSEWRIYGPSCRALLCVLQPFIFEKAEQVVLALSVTSVNYRENDLAMKRLKGRQL